jgi:hypothetical protein
MIWTTFFSLFSYLKKVGLCNPTSVCVCVPPFPFIFWIPEPIFMRLGICIVTCRPMSRQRSKYEHATIEKVLQEVFSMWSAPCPLLGNGSLNTFPQKQTRGTIGHLLIGKSAVNRLCQQYRLCFPWDPCKVVIRESSSEADSSDELSV